MISLKVFYCLCPCGFGFVELSAAYCLVALHIFSPFDFQNEKVSFSVCLLYRYIITPQKTQPLFDELKSIKCLRLTHKNTSSTFFFVSYVDLVTLFT